MASFLQRKSRNYLVIDKSNQPGNFFNKFPRHDTLISINKRYTSKDNTEFNLRHDWNSLLSENRSLKFTRYSEEYYPVRQDYLKYLEDFYFYEEINAQFNTRIEKIVRLQTKSLFVLTDQKKRRFICKYLIIATGLEVPIEPVKENSEILDTYEFMDTDPMTYQDKDIAIIGGGNAAFEVANSLLSEASSILIVKRKPLGLSFNTHYVGDLRAINAKCLDLYTFSLLVGIVEVPNGISIVEKVDGQIMLPELEGVQTEREPLFDKVIRCTGWRFNWTFLEHYINQNNNSKPKYPSIYPNYESKDIENLYFIGAASHYIDKGKSSGGFIHGFRYTTKVVHKVMEWKYEGEKWSYYTYKLNQLLNHLLRRINEGSANYQMFGVLGDIFVIDKLHNQYYLIEEYPLLDIPNLEYNTGFQVDKMELLIFRFQYNHEYSGVGRNTLSSRRVQSSFRNPQFSNFIHPVLYHYLKLPSSDLEGSYEFLWQPDSIHHSIEDFKTNFGKLDATVIQMMNYFNNVLQIDTKYYSRDDLIMNSMTSIND